MAGRRIVTSVRGRFTLPLLLAGVTVAGGLVAVACVQTAQPKAARESTTVRADVRVSVDPGSRLRPVPRGFLGLSIEYWALEAYAGKNPRAVNPVLVRLLRRLGWPTVLRIGGVSTDKTWWPVPGVRRPPGVNYSLTPRRLAVMRALADAVGARLLMGVNLEADNTMVASAEASAIVSAIGRSRIAALELGNEPELYGNHAFGWYMRAGARITARPRTYRMADYIREFSRLGAVTPGVPLAGPASGGSRWLTQLGSFNAAEPRLGLVTIHRYPLQACYNAPGSPVYPTIGTLLSSSASDGSAEGAVPYVAVAHARRLPLRIDEMNNISCGVPRGIPDTFAMALWVLDALFADARAGVDGVNIHTYPTAVYQLFRFTRSHAGWRAVVEPEYYGLLMFAEAARPGSTLVDCAGGTSAIRAWATRDRRGAVRVVLINDDVARSHVVVIRVVGARGVASVERLQAPSAGATQEVTYAGQSFGRTGILTGPRTTSDVRPAAGMYLVRMPPASAALVTVR